MIGPTLIHTPVAIGTGAAALTLTAHAADHRRARPHVTAVLALSAIWSAGLAAWATHLASTGTSL